jgi:signal transduction histidine kinase
MNEKFLEVTLHKSADVITAACDQVLQLLDKLNMSAIPESPKAEGTDDGRRGIAVNQQAAMVTRSGHRSSNARVAVVGCISNSRRVQPVAVAEQQTPFDEAMRVRMAELVENNHDETNGLSAKVRQVTAQFMSALGTSQHWSHLLYRNPAEDGMYDVFLNFRDPAYNSPEKQSDYLTFKRSAGSIPLHNFVLGLTILYVGTLLRFVNAEEYTHNPTALLAIVGGALTCLMSITILLLRLTLFSLTYNMRALQRFHPFAVRFYKSRYSQCLDDGFVISGALTMSFYIFSRLLAPACPPDSTTLYFKGCSRQGAIPPEALLSVIVVVMHQMVARGASRLGLVVAWVIVLVTINISLWLVGSMSYLWVNGELACLMAISYELERLPLRQFMKSVRMLEASECNVQLKVALSKYQVREGERALEAKRSMVRHVGHEIRTPLNIIGVGTDVLLKELQQLGPAIPPSILEVVEGIEEASTAALEVVNELLMFEKLAAGMTTIDTAPTYIVRFIEKAMKQHLIPARAKSIDFKLTVEARDRDMGVDIDPIKMVVVFRNIFR